MNDKKNMKIYNTKELQEIFGFKKTKMTQFLRSGVLPTVKIGSEYMISEEQLLDWFKRNGGTEIDLNKY